MKTIFYSLLLFCSVQLSFAQSLTMDKNHSKLGFSVSHLTISDVEGQFDKWDAEVSFAKDDLSDLKFKVQVDANSINTSVEARDKHLKSADFFEVEKFPGLEFTSDKITKVKGNLYQLHGTLTIKGISKPVDLDLFYNGKIVNAQNKTESFGFTVKGKFNRMDFGVGKTFPSNVIGEEVSMKANMEFVKK